MWRSQWVAGVSEGLPSSTLPEVAFAAADFGKYVDQVKNMVRRRRRVLVAGDHPLAGIVANVDLSAGDDCTITAFACGKCKTIITVTHGNQPPTCPNCGSFEREQL